MRERLERVALLLAALLLAATLFDPSLPAERALVEHLVVVDITQSMNVADAAIDGQPATRIDAAKAALGRAVSGLACGSKVGWGVFTEYRAFVLLAPVEVCANRRELLATLEYLDGRVAWSGNSEVAKGLGSSLRASRELPGSPSIVFVTDGHEAPPVNPRYRPAVGVVRGEVPGLIVGIGGDRPLPIPKTDPSGAPIGIWRAGDVLQTDPRSLGRGGSVANEAMVDDQDMAPAAPLPGATPGTEHLSSLREPYLQLLADETGLGYHRLRDADSLLGALTEPSLAHLRPSRADLRPWLGTLAFVALLVGLGLTAPPNWRWRTVR